MRTRAILLAFSFLLTNVAFAEPGTVVFANGMNCDRDCAILARLALEESLEDRLPSTEFAELAFANAFNQDGSLVNEILEVVSQDPEIQLTLAQILNLLSNRDPWPEGFAQLVGVAIGLASSRPVTAEDLDQHLKLYRNSFGAGRPVTIVAHSQGNYFANQSHRLLEDDERDGLGIVAVGTPDDRKEGILPGFWFNGFHDVVIDGARPVTNALPANTNQFDLISFLIDPSGHLFRRSYLRQAQQSSPLILDAISVMIGRLQAPLPPIPDQPSGPVATIQNGSVAYVRMVEGNPGIPDDGRVVESPSNIRIRATLPTTVETYELRTPIAIRNAVNGDSLTISFFPPVGVDLSDPRFVFDDMTVFFRFATPNTANTCDVIGFAEVGGAPGFSERPIIDGVEGVAVWLDPLFLQSMIVSNPSLGICVSGEEEGDLVLTHMGFAARTDGFTWESVPLDAAAVGIGQLLVPTTNTPAP